MERFREEADGCSLTSLSEKRYLANRVLTVIKADTDLAKLSETLEAQGATLDKVLWRLSDGRSIAAIRTDTPTLDSAARLVAAVEATGLCEHTSFNTMGQIKRVSNDVSVRSGSSMVWQWERVHAPRAWDVATDSSSILVAVVDTGVTVDAPDLADNIWTNPGEIPGNGIDDDGNGLVDDVHGTGVFLGAYYPDFIWDTDGHGTHCAGLVGAVGNNGIGTVGSAWRAQILTVNFAPDIEEETEVDEGDIAAIIAENWIAGMGYAVNTGAKILSCSFGDYNVNPTLEAFMDDFGTKDIIIVCAAGNESTDTDVTPMFPASYSAPNIVAVAALDTDDTLAVTSNWGAETVDIAAPGVDIMSTCYDSYVGLSGTSMATPIVAGAAALLWAQNPSATALEVIQHLYDTGEPLDSLAGKIKTGKLLNMGAALETFVPKLSLTATQGTETNQVSLA